MPEINIYLIWSWLSSLRTRYTENPSTNSSSQTLRFPTVALESSSQVQFASMKQKCSYFEGQKPKGNSLFCVIGFSFSCTASLLRHSPRKDLEFQFEFHICMYDIYSKKEKKKEIKFDMTRIYFKFLCWR